MRTSKRVSIFLLGSLASAFFFSAQAQRLSGRDKTAISRAENFFSEAAETGDLDVRAAYELEAQPSGGGSQQGTLTLVVDLEPMQPELGSLPGGPRFLVSLVVESRGGDTWIEHREVAAPTAAFAAAWSLEARLELPEELRDLVVIVEEPTSGLWGVVAAELEGEELELPERTALAVESGVWSVLSGAGSDAPPSSPPPGGQLAGSPVSPGPPPGSVMPEPTMEPAPPAVSGANPVIRLLPPRAKKADKGTKIETLVADFEVAKVVFYLDGKEVATAVKDPFEARIDLAGPGKGQTLRAVAHSMSGKELGADQLVVNDPAKSFRVRLLPFELPAGGGAGKLAIEAQLAVPVTVRLASVELYFNEQRITRWNGPPYRAEIPLAAAPSEADYVRVVATASDGAQVEDVRLLSARGVSEAIDVTLVQLYAVVTDKSGKPVTTLAPEDFSLRLNGKAQQVERASFATDVPLLLGLVVDTSGSMEFIMNETKQAAAQFLDRTVLKGDQAFLVDFSTKPRLRHRATGNVQELIASFRGMRADGFTALFDSVIFSLLEYTQGPSRRALVVLTDGDDYGSKFGARRAIQSAQRLGVPVYVIALTLRNELRGTTVLDLEAITDATGGRLYFATGFEDLTRAYAEINEELRSQYLITFYAPSGTSLEDLRDVDLNVRGRGLEVRSVVGAM